MRPAFLTVALFLSFGLKALEVPEKFQGNIDKVFCGEAAELGGSSLGEFCMLSVTSQDDRFAVVFSDNEYLSLVPDGESNDILVGRTASFRSCEELDKSSKEVLEGVNMDSTYKVIQCYENFTQLVIPKEDALKASDIAGEYVNAQGNEASVEVSEEEQDDLFSPPKFTVQVKFRMQDGPEEIWIQELSSTDFYLVKKDQRSYFLASYMDDCDDPDCFNMDGTIKFVENEDGSFAMNLNFDYYNNAPTGEEVGEDYLDQEFWLQKKD